jgi:ATP-dependent Zn protease
VYERDPRNLLNRPDLPLPQREETCAEETAAAIYEEVRGIVRSAMDWARAIRREKRDVLGCSARKLLEKETLDDTIWRR